MIKNLKDLKDKLNEIDDELLSATHIGVVEDEPKYPTMIYMDTRDLEWEQVIAKLEDVEEWKEVEQFFQNILGFEEYLKQHDKSNKMDEYGCLVCTSGTKTGLPHDR